MTASERKNVKELENEVLREIDADSKETFIYRLHECDFFDKDKFQRLVSDANELADYWIDEGKTENYAVIAKEIADTFMYTMLRLHCHFDPVDLSVIGNYEDIRDDLYDFMIDDMRNTLRKLIF